MRGPVFPVRKFTKRSSYKTVTHVQRAKVGPMQLSWLLFQCAWALLSSGQLTQWIQVSDDSLTCWRRPALAFCVKANHWCKTWVPYVFPRSSPHHTPLDAVSVLHLMEYFLENSSSRNHCFRSMHLKMIFLVTGWRI